MTQKKPSPQKTARPKTFDADEYLKAMTPPSITVDGVTYTGKLLSFSATLALQSRSQTEMGQLEMIDYIRDVCNALEIPADVVLQLPPSVVMKALESFFLCLMDVPETSI